MGGEDTQYIIFGVSLFSPSAPEKKNVIKRRRRELSDPVSPKLQRVKQRLKVVLGYSNSSSEQTGSTTLTVCLVIGSSGLWYMSRVPEISSKICSLS